MLSSDDTTPASVDDPIDVAIVREVSRNARATLAELSTAAGLSVSAVQTRLRRLESRGVITGYRAVIDAESVGKPLSAFIEITPLDPAQPDGVVVEPGDMLLLHTGFATRVLEWDKNPDPREIFTTCAYLDAKDEALLDWIATSQISALVADNYAVEGLLGKDRDPSRHSFLPIHHLCLFKLGVPLGELWYLHELAAWLRANERSRFLLTAPPLRLPGAVGSPVTPVATV